MVTESHDKEKRLHVTVYFYVLSVLKKSGEKTKKKMEREQDEKGEHAHINITVKT